MTKSVREITKMEEIEISGKINRREKRAEEISNEEKCLINDEKVKLSLCSTNKNRKKTIC